MIGRELPKLDVARPSSLHARTKAGQILCAVILVVLPVTAACAGASPAPGSASPQEHGRGHGHLTGRPELPACAELAKTCHAHDKDSEEAHACHVLGHGAPSNEACEARRARCLAVCAGDGGT